MDQLPANLIFQKPLGYLVRHGSTEANTDNCFRGWIDFPLDDEGRQAAEAVQNFFSYERLGRVFCSDLSRAVQTAQYIIDGGNVSCPYLSVEPSLRPWNIGDFAGQKKSKATLDKFHKYVEDSSLVIPEGESLDQFRHRNQIIMDYLAVPYEGYPNVIVAHTSNLTACQHCAEEQNEAQEEESDIVGPGGIVAVYLINNQLQFVPRLGSISVSEPTGVS